MAGRASAGGGFTGGVTTTSMPNSSMETIQKFVDQFGTGMSVEQMVEKVYNALPSIGGRTEAIHGLGTNKGASILNGRYLSMDNGTTYQFIRQRSKGTWKVKQL